MSIHVNFFCQFNHTGVGRHCENAFFAMERNRPAGLGLEYVNFARQDAVRQAIASAREQTDITAFFWRYPLPLVRQFRGRKVIWWFFESDRLPRKWIDEIEPYDEIWAPSPWGRNVLLAHGVRPERTRVVESGINAQIFRPAARPHEGFVFLSVGKYENRKSIDETVTAFAAEFPAESNPGVQLWLKADFPLFPERVHQLAAKWAHDPRVRVISAIFSDEQMAELYQSADAFVFPSKAEGFGLPCLEAIACGLPTIATNTSAQGVFLDMIPGRFAPVEYDMVPIVDDDYASFYGADYGGLEFGNWAVPSIESIRRAMRDVFDRRQAWRERALQAAKIVREAFSWDAIALKAIGAVRDIHARAGGRLDA